MRGEAVEAHHFGVPHSHDVKAAGVLGIDLQAFEGLGADVLAYLIRARGPWVSAFFPSARARLKWPSASPGFSSTARRAYSSPFLK